MTITIDPTKPSEIVLEDGLHVITLAITVAHKAEKPVSLLPPLTVAAQAAYQRAAKVAEKYSKDENLRAIGATFLHALLAHMTKPEDVRRAFQLAQVPEPAAFYVIVTTEGMPGADSVLGIVHAIHEALIVAAQPGLVA